MKTNFIVIALLFPLLLVGQNKDQLIEALISDYLSSNSPGLALIATQDQNILYEKAFGLSDISTGEKIQTNDLFRIGSITKQFTATAILKMAHDKRLDLEDSIEKYLPNIVLSQKITIKQLLQHISGLGNQSDIPEYNTDSIDLNNYPKQMIQPILSSSLKFSPGSDYAYSNLGYIVLGYILERVSGMSYERYLKKTFFEPLNMDSTGFEYLESDISPTSRGYSSVNGKYEEANPINMKIAYSAGGLVSNLQDLVKWNNAIMTGK